MFLFNLVGSLFNYIMLNNFSTLYSIVGMDVAASNARTRELLDWEPTGPTLLADIAAGAYGG